MICTIGSTKGLIDKTNNGEKVPSLEVVEAVLVQCNLGDNQCQQKSEILYTFTPNKFCPYLFNVVWNLWQHLQIKMVDR